MAAPDENWPSPGRDGPMEPEVVGRGMAKQCALVIMGDDRPARAATLILQELGMSVDVAAEPEGALAWLCHARYDAVILGGPGEIDIEYAAHLRGAAGASRVLLFAEPGAKDRARLEALGIEVVGPPFDVNALVERFLHRDAA